MNKDELLGLKTTEVAYFPDDPDQSTVQAIGAVLNYFNADEEVAYALGRVLRWSCGLGTYVDTRYGAPDVEAGPVLDGFQRAVADQEHDPRPWYGA